MKKRGGGSGRPRRTATHHYAQISRYAERCVATATREVTTDSNARVNHKDIFITVCRGRKT